MTNKKQAIVIGGGCAGITAAIYMARAGVSVKMFTGYEHGSLSDSPLVENFPGFEGISGFELVEKMRYQALHNGVEIIDSIIEKINPFENTVLSESGEVYAYDGLVISTGSKPRKLTAENANKYESRGIHYCAVCDGALYKNKTVGVIGGGDTALTESLYLAKICGKVIMFVRRNQFRGSECLVQKVLNNSSIEVLWNTEIVSVSGNDRLEKVVCNNGKEIELDGLFAAIGNEPNDSIIKDAFGENYTNKYIGNVAICGDCFKNPYRQAVIACADGAKAAMYLNETVF